MFKTYVDSVGAYNDNILTIHRRKIAMEEYDITINGLFKEAAAVSSSHIEKIVNNNCSKEFTVKKNQLLEGVFPEELSKKIDDILERRAECIYEIKHFTKHNTRIQIKMDELVQMMYNTIEGYPDTTQNLLKDLIESIRIVG